MPQPGRQTEAEAQTGRGAASKPLQGGTCLGGVRSAAIVNPSDSIGATPFIAWTQEV